MNEFIEQLFIAAGAAPERIITFSCDHVIPEENIICNIITHGPTGIEFEFNFQNRENTKLVNIKIYLNNNFIIKLYYILYNKIIYKYYLY